MRALSRKHVCTRGYVRSDGYKRASFHSVPFRHSIRAARPASKLSPARCSDLSPPHSPRCAGFMPPFARRGACILYNTRVSVHACVDNPPTSAGTDCGDLRPGMPFPFGKHLGSRTGYNRDIVHARPRIIGNYRKLILDREGPGKEPGGAPKVRIIRGSRAKVSFVSGKRKHKCLEPAPTALLSITI